MINHFPSLNLETTYVVDGTPCTDICFYYTRFVFWRWLGVVVVKCRWLVATGGHWGSDLWWADWLLPGETEIQKQPQVCSCRQAGKLCWWSQGLLTTKSNQKSVWCACKGVFLLGSYWRYLSGWTSHRQDSLQELCWSGGLFLSWSICSRSVKWSSAISKVQAKLNWSSWHLRASLVHRSATWLDHSDTSESESTCFHNITLQHVGCR